MRGGLLVWEVSGCWSIVSVSCYVVWEGQTNMSRLDGHWKKWLPRWPNVNVASHMIFYRNPMITNDLFESPRNISEEY